MPALYMAIKGANQSLLSRMRHESIRTTYGIPYKFFTDHHTVFTYTKKNSPPLDEDTYTQFAYACK